MGGINVSDGGYLDEWYKDRLMAIFTEEGIYDLRYQDWIGVRMERSSSPAAEPATVEPVSTLTLDTDMGVLVPDGSPSSSCVSLDGIAANELGAVLAEDAEAVVSVGELAAVASLGTPAGRCTNAMKSSGEWKLTFSICSGMKHPLTASARRASRSGRGHTTAIFEKPAFRHFPT